ncbi:ABC transporter substrate-binding protein [Thermoleptolyngbya sp.]
MFYRIYRHLQFGLLVVLAIALVNGCNTISSNPNQSASTADQQDCYVVQHAVGETCIPTHPTRIVALDSGTLEHLLALGIRPVGAVLSYEFSKFLDTAGIVDIGAAEEPNLEKILTLQPDLIIGGDYYETIYQQSSKIAPTILLGHVLWGGSGHSGEWKEAFMKVAELLQKTEIAEQVMGSYYARLDEFKQQMGEALQQTEVSVVRLYPDRINLYLKDSFCGTVLQDAGLSRPSAQAIDADTARQRFGNAIQFTISKEVLSQADGDVMFVWTGENTPEANRQAQTRLKEIQSDPLWQKLNVVKKNKVHQVPSYWIGIGPIAANAIIDDLYNYLVKPSS